MSEGLAADAVCPINSYTYIYIHMYLFHVDIDSIQIPSRFHLDSIDHIIDLYDQSGGHLLYWLCTSSP